MSDDATWLTMTPSEQWAERCAMANKFEHRIFRATQSWKRERVAAGDVLTTDGGETDG